MRMQVGARGWVLVPVGLGSSAGQSIVYFYCGDEVYGRRCWRGGWFLGRGVVACVDGCGGGCDGYWGGGRVDWSLSLFEGEKSSAGGGRGAGG